MKYTQAEKYEIIRLVEESDLGVLRTLRELGIPKSTFYTWYGRYRENGYDGLSEGASNPRKFWNKIPDHERERVKDVALDQTDKSPRELAWYITDNLGYFISESSVYRILKSYDMITSPNYIVMAASDKFKHPTTRVHEMWQTDFTYLKVITWGWYYLSTILDDYSRYIIAWKLFRTMSAQDVQETLDLAREEAGIETATVSIRPRLLSDNGPCYISGELKDYLADLDMKHSRGRPFHPQTQGKIERWHRTMKNEIKLHHYYSLTELESAIGRFVYYYNNERYHESLDNVKPVDVYHGRRERILKKRDKIKLKTLEERKRINLLETV